MVTRNMWNELMTVSCQKENLIGEKEELRPVDEDSA